uniref:Uncharacterized protein n=1 Tax=Zea mays TaxID=4577 RepID=C0PM70_MAIZE|nr:unknown [Zea mays]
MAKIRFGDVEMELDRCRSTYPVLVGLSTDCCIREPQSLQSTVMIIAATVLT